MKRLQFLSHTLSMDVSGYGGDTGFRSEAMSRICDGRSSNSSRWILSNHIGTHIDAPYHFSENGLRLDDFPADFWIFKASYLADVPLEAGSLILPGKWCEAIPAKCDLLLIRTGFEYFRGTEIYWKNNPGLSPDLANWLRANRQGIRAVGLDVISATAFQHKEIGRLAHRAFLFPADEEKAILIIEDMSLVDLKGSPLWVVVAPLMVTDADGAPTTIFAEIDEM